MSQEFQTASAEYHSARDALIAAHARAFNAIRPYISAVINCEPSEELTVLRLMHLANNRFHGEHPVTESINRELARQALDRAVERMEFRAYNQRHNDADNEQSIKEI